MNQFSVSPYQIRHQQDVLQAARPAEPRCSGVKNGAEDRTVGWMAESLGRILAGYLGEPARGYEPFTPSDAQALCALLEPADVLLFKGNDRVSGVIKYLTRSKWSHAALYVGTPGERVSTEGETLTLVEARLAKAWWRLRCRNMPATIPASAGPSA